MKKIAFILLLLAGFCPYLHAQTAANIGKDLFFVGYEVTIPTNNNYLSNTSWSGARFDYRKMITPNVSVGIGASFNSFEQYFTKQTYQRPDGTGAVTSDMIRQVYTSPITASVHYYLQGSNKVTPYVGIGLGAQYSEQDAYFNIYSVEARNWGFVVRPELGAIGKVSLNTSLFISAAYNYATNKNGAFNIDHLGQFPITVGLVFNAR